ncbi:MAG: hypothetical protein ACI8Z7_000318 [Candidatus Nanohaloarchaea archaeon]|jgi:hypothetical protein
MELTFMSHTLIFDLPPENIAMLAALWVLTFGSYFYLRKMRTERMTQLGNFETLKEVHGHKTSASPAVLGMKLVIVTLLFLAATGAVEYQSSFPVQNTDYVIAVDTSPSMSTPDYEPDRLGFTKQILSDYIQRMPGESEKTVVEFSGTVTVESSETEDSEQTLDALNRLEPDLENPGTSLASALEISVETLQESEKDRKVILVTDGHTSSQNEISEVTEQAEQENVEINIVALEQKRGLEDLYDELGENITGDPSNSTGGSFTGLRQVSERTGGEYLPVYSQESFDLAVKNIVIEQEQLGLNSDYVIMIFISMLVITEIWVYSRYGAI